MKNKFNHVLEKHDYRIKKEYKRIIASREGISVVYGLSKKLEQTVEQEVRVSVSGHVKRGGHPCPYDRYLSSLFGVKGAKCVLNEEYGQFVILKNNNVETTPLQENAGKLQFVDITGQDIEYALDLGISFANKNLKF